MDILVSKNTYTWGENLWKIRTNTLALNTQDIFFVISCEPLNYMQIYIATRRATISNKKCVRCSLSLKISMHE